MINFKTLMSLWSGMDGDAGCGTLVLACDRSGRNLTYVEWNDEVERMSRLDRFGGRTELSGAGSPANPKKKLCPKE